MTDSYFGENTVNSLAKKSGPYVDMGNILPDEGCARSNSGINPMKSARLKAMKIRDMNI